MSTSLIRTASRQEKEVHVRQNAERWTMYGLNHTGANEIGVVHWKVHLCLYNETHARFPALSYNRKKRLSHRSGRS